MPLDDVRVSVLDRAFMFGDAVYEVIRVYSGRAFLRGPHMDRLRRSLKEIHIDADVARIDARMGDTLARSGVAEGMVYIQVTRGAAPRRHQFPDPPVPPNELIYIEPLDGDPYDHLRENGASLLTVPDFRWGRCDIKSVNLLANCMAAQQAKAAGCLEALLIAEDGTVTEGSHTSAFGVKDGRVIASPLDEHILPGITRALMLELCRRAGVEVVQHRMQQSDLVKMDELFLTGTTSEVLPVTKVDDKPIGTGRPGPVTARLYEAYHAHLQDWLKESD